MFSPVTLCLEILFLGLILLWFTRKQRTGKVVLSVGFLFLALLSFSAASDELLRPLEYEYPPILKSEGISGMKWVVVLGGGHISDPQIPNTSQLNGASVARLVEGIRLYKMLPGSKLILSGGSTFDPIPNAKIMADVAIAIGVDKRDLILETTSKDTKDQARLIKEIVGKDSFVMVTSAAHMPRSMALFEKHGMKPIPAPTGYGVKQSQGASPELFFPRAHALLKAELAVYEYLGMVWAKISGEM